jgi:uncharacterized protein (DUF488 family)
MSAWCPARGTTRSSIVMPCRVRCKTAGIGYTHLPGLGGLRHARVDSPNSGWRNASFRGFADYMQTAEFAGNLQHLIELAQLDRVAVMCAEAVPWRCHRSLIADALLVRGVTVEHISRADYEKKNAQPPGEIGRGWAAG